jgi:monoamine oxidase
MLDVVIIGAGAAGIAAARHATELGLSALLVEANDRVGGRASTDNDTFGVPFDLGCYWFHSPEHNPLIGHANKLGIPYLASGQKTHYVRDGRWLNGSEANACEEYIEACFERIAAHIRHGQDRAVCELFDASNPWHAAFEAEFTAKQGVPPQQSSTYDFARYVWTGEDLPVIGGFGNLIHRLAADLPISLNTPVSRIELLPQSVRVSTAQGTIEARTVIVTVSTGVLRSGAIQFVPKLPDWKQGAIDVLPMGHCNKVAISFLRPALGACDNWLVVPLRSGFEAVELVLKPGGHEMAVALFNGPFGKELAEAGVAAMVDYAVERLVDVFGADLRQALSPVHAAVDWDGDPHVLGCFSAALPGRADARIDLARPVDDRLFFAGEATSLRFMGDVHGAWLSGIDAANAAARVL